MKALLNLSDETVRRKIIYAVAKARGIHRLELTRCREQRTLSQNAYYWGVVLPAVAEGIMEAWGEQLDPEEIHDFLKQRFLTKPVVNRNTGEVTGETTHSTTALDTSAFAGYLDKIIRFAAEFLSTEIPAAQSLTEASK